MKVMKIWIITMTILAAFFLTSCSSDDNGETPELIIDPVEVDLEQPTATTTLDF